MNCEQFAQALGANPNDINAAMHEHVAGCEPCAQLMQELNEFDKVLKAAIDVDVPATLGHREPAGDNVVHLSSRTGGATPIKQPKWMALAAVMVLGIGLAVGTWYGRVSASLPQSLVAHVKHEPELLTDEWQVVSVAQTERVLTQGGASLNGDIGTVRHAGMCSFRGNKVAHVVIHTDKGPVTVMLLPDEAVQSPTSFDEEGYKGVMVPMGDGSIAIIGNDSEAMDEVRDDVTSNLSWTI